MPRAIHYSTRERFDAFAGADVVVKLLDFNRDDLEDAGAFDAWLDRAENLVDSSLRQKYVVPFEDIATGELDPAISDLTDTALYMLLMEQWRPGSEDAAGRRKAWEARISRLLDGDEELDEAKVAAGAGREFLAVSSHSAGPVFSGYGPTGKSRMRGW